MRFSTLVAGCALLCVPVVALAIPPYQAKKQSTSRVAARTPVSYGTPSLSPAAQAAVQQYKAKYYQSAGRSTSMLPAASNYRRSSSAASARPTQGSSFAQRLQNRQLNNRPDVVINRPDINVYQPTINRPITNIRNTINNTTVINQNFGNQSIDNRHVTNVQVNNYQQPRPYYRQLHYHWQPSSWGGSYRPTYYNYTYSTSSGGLLSVGTTSYAYVNPFYVRPAQTVAVRFDYSRPIHVPSPDYRETAEDLIRSERAIRRFDDAREVFRRGEYGRANDLIDEAIDLLPNDPTLHQFRALVLFARGRYPDAATTLYSVLAVSAGWNAATVAKLYDDPKHYLAQAGELERYVVANPRALDARFLLAYHCVLKGDLATAERLLESVRVAKPNDRVVQNLLIALRG